MRCHSEEMSLYRESWLILEGAMTSNVVLTICCSALCIAHFISMVHKSKISLATACIANGIPAVMTVRGLLQGGCTHILGEVKPTERLAAL